MTVHTIYFFQSAYTIRDRFDINEKVVDASVRIRH